VLIGHFFEQCFATARGWARRWTVRLSRGGRDSGHAYRKVTVTSSATRGARAAAGLFMMLILTLAACGGSTSGRPVPGKASPAPTSRRLALGHEKLEPGTYVVDPGRKAAALGFGHPPKFEITVPAGWSSLGGWAMHKGRLYTAPAFVTFWEVDRVYATPCKWKDKPMVDPAHSVDALASALAKQPLRSATAPGDVVFGGFSGKYLQWSVPTNIAFDEAQPEKALFPDCDEKTFQSWTGAPGWASDRYQQAPGQVDWIWILDVQGEPLVIDASYLPTATARERRELKTIVDSIRFVD
jgi:hypothetical protein